MCRLKNVQEAAAVHHSLCILRKTNCLCRCTNASERNNKYELIGAWFGIFIKLKCDMSGLVAEVQQSSSDWVVAG